MIKLSLLDRILIKWNCSHNPDSSSAAIWIHNRETVAIVRLKVERTTNGICSYANLDSSDRPLDFLEQIISPTGTIDECFCSVKCQRVAAIIFTFSIVVSLFHDFLVRLILFNFVCKTFKLDAHTHSKVYILPFWPILVFWQLVFYNFCFAHLVEYSTASFSNSNVDFFNSYSLFKTFERPNIFFRTQLLSNV